MFSLPLLPLAGVWREFRAEGKGLTGSCAGGKHLGSLGEHRETLGSSSVLTQDWDGCYSRRNRRGSPLPFYDPSPFLNPACFPGS